jgi:actin
VTNWDDMEKIWHHTFYNELRVAPEQHPVLLLVHDVAPARQLERTVQIMFETFNVPAVAIVSAAVAALAASGRVTGVVLAIGDTETIAVPVCNGQAVRHAIRTLGLGGRLLVDYFMKINTERGYSFTTTSERDVVRDMLAKLAFVSHDFEASLQQAAASPAAFERSYELPDGQVITIGNECFRVAEVLFAPFMLGFEAEGIHELVFGAILACDHDLQVELFANVVLAGGTSLIPGLDKRLQKEGCC